MGSSRLREVLEAELSLYAMYIRNPLYRHPLNTDASLFRQFSLSPGKALTFSINSTHLPRTPFEVDNGHLFLTQSTDSHTKSTSLMQLLYCQLCAVIDLSF